MYNEIESIAFAECHKMTTKDIESFAECLAEGFKGYPLYEHISGSKYNLKKIKAFWVATLKVVKHYALCYSSDSDINSAMIYLPPRTHDPQLLDYIIHLCLKEFLTLGPGPIYRLVKFNNIAQKIAKKHINSNCGYLMAIATKPELQKSGHGKKILNALIDYLNATHQDCYLETLKAGNVALYEHFDFSLKETSHLMGTKLPIFAMHYTNKRRRL